MFIGPYHHLGEDADSKFDDMETWLIAGYVLVVAEGNAMPHTVCQACWTLNM